MRKKSKGITMKAEMGVDTATDGGAEERKQN